MACLSDWLAEGNANGAIAFAMYAVFVLVVPLLHVLALLAWALCREPCPLAVRLSRTLGKLSMLDVSMMGVVVIVLALTNLRAKGTVVALGPGIGPLIGAELCRYALGFIAEPRVAAADMAPIVKGGSSPSPCSQDPPHLRDSGLRGRWGRICPSTSLHSLPQRTCTPIRSGALPSTLDNHPANLERNREDKCCPRARLARAHREEYIVF